MASDETPAGITNDMLGSHCRMVRKKTNYCWRCPLKGCQAVKSLRDGSFFARNHLGLDVIVDLMYFWRAGDGRSERGWGVCEGNHRLV